MHRAQFVRTSGSRSTFLAREAPAPARQPRAPERRALTEPEARHLLSEAGHGLHLDAWRLVSCADGAVQAVTELGGRCALKIVSSQVVHKSDSGGVALDVTPNAAADAFQGILEAVDRHHPGANVDGILVTPMAPIGIELIIGGSHDPVFGPIIAFGPGGTLVELLGSPAFRSAPITPLEATELLQQGPVSRLLGGYRDLPAVDHAALAAYLVGVSKLIAANPRIAELDLNPVIASGSDLVAVDARVVVWD